MQNNKRDIFKDAQLYGLKVELSFYSVQFE